MDVFLQVLEYKAKNKRTKETLLTCLADLFYSIVTQKRKVYFTIKYHNNDHCDEDDDLAHLPR